jgi:uncharacterized protein YciI
MEFDTYSIALLVRRADAPKLGGAEIDALQDAHMAHLAELHEAGHLLAAGPVRGDRLRGLSILRVDVDRARELKEADPAVQAGLYTIEVLPWLVPAGAMTFSPAHFPRSMEEARD